MQQPGAKKSGDPEKGGTPSDNASPGGGNRRDGDTPGTTEEPLPPSQADPKHAIHAGELQLEKFKRNADNSEVQKAMKMKPEEMRRLVEAIENDWKRRKAALEKDDKLPAPKQGSKLSNLPAEAVGPGDAKKIEALNAGASKAPRPYREAQKQFSKSQSDQGRPASKE